MFEQFSAFSMSEGPSFVVISYLRAQKLVCRLKRGIVHLKTMTKETKMTIQRALYHQDSTLHSISAMVFLFQFHIVHSLFMTLSSMMLVLSMM